MVDAVNRDPALMVADAWYAADEMEKALYGFEQAGKASTDGDIDLRRGYILTLDYGYRASELYAPWRRQGTLLTFYRQTSGALFW